MRYYEPALGRFITQDPIGLAGGMNLYRFEGTVQNQVDPLGLVVQVIAASWLLEGLAYVGTAMAGILVAAGIMDATEEEDKAEVQETEASKCEKERKKRCKKWGIGQPEDARRKVRRGQGSKNISMIHRPNEDNVPGSQWHAHDFGGEALNLDGTLHHKNYPNFNNDDKDFLFCHGWNI